MATNKHGAVGVRSLDTGEVTICAEGGTAGYHTLCGTSLNDAEFEEAEIASNARINCPRCKELWNTARLLKAKDFT